MINLFISPLQERRDIDGTIASNIYSTEEATSLPRQCPLSPISKLTTQKHHRLQTGGIYNSSTPAQKQKQKQAHAPLLLHPTAHNNATHNTASAQHSPASWVFLRHNTPRTMKAHASLLFSNDAIVQFHAIIMRNALLYSRHKIIP